MRNGAVVDLGNGLVVFGDEDGFVVANHLTNPDVVVVVSVFDGLSGFPRASFDVKFLLRDGSQAVAVVPFVQLAVRGVSVTLNIGKIPTYLP